jgi:hypothetical protein
MDALTLFGLLAVSAMLVCYAFEAPKAEAGLREAGFHASSIARGL